MPKRKAAKRARTTATKKSAAEQLQDGLSHVYAIPVCPADVSQVTQTPTTGPTGQGLLNMNIQVPCNLSATEQQQLMMTIQKSVSEFGQSVKDTGRQTRRGVARSKASATTPAASSSTSYDTQDTHFPQTSYHADMDTQAVVQQPHTSPVPEIGSVPSIPWGAPTTGRDVSGDISLPNVLPHASPLSHINHSNDDHKESSSFLSAAVPLDSRVPQRLKNKIWAGEFVEMASLLASNQSEAIQYSLAMTGLDDGAPSWTCTPKMSRGLQSIHQWISAFEIFMTVYLAKSPQEHSGLLQYQARIRSIAAARGNWQFYDREFRLIKQSNPNVGWGDLQLELWFRALHDPSIKQLPNSAERGTQRAPARKQFARQERKFPRGFCDRFHSGQVCRTPCKFSHVCFKCSKDHSYAQCPAKQDGFRGSFRAQHTSTGGRIPQVSSGVRCGTDGSTRSSRLQTLDKTVDTLLLQSLAPSTQSAYNRSWVRLHSFAQDFHLAVDLPLTVSFLCLFVAHLFAEGYTASSVLSTLSAVSFQHKLHGMFDPTSAFVVKKLVAGIQRLRPQTDIRMPITEPILGRLIHSLHRCSQSAYQCALFRALYSVAFYSFARIGEFCISKSDDHNRVVQLGDVTFTTGGMQIIFRHFKHNITSRPHIIHLKTQIQHEACPVQLLKSYISLRGSQAGPLFAYPDGTGVRRKQFDTTLHAALQFCGLCPSYYKGHSFRIGAATAAAQRGLSDSQIRQLGRWHSDAFKKYIRVEAL